MGKITPEFGFVWRKRTNKYFDELHSDERLQNPEAAFKSHVFYPFVDTAMAWDSFRAVRRTAFSVYSVNFSLPTIAAAISDTYFELAANQVQQTYSSDHGG